MNTDQHRYNGGFYRCLDKRIYAHPVQVWFKVADFESGCRPYVCVATVSEARSIIDGQRCIERMHAAGSACYAVCEALCKTVSARGEINSRTAEHSLAEVRNMAAAIIKRVRK